MLDAHDRAPRLSMAMTMSKARYTDSSRRYKHYDGSISRLSDDLLHETT